MATNDFYRPLPANTLLRVTDEFGPLDTWEAAEHTEQLLVASALVSTTDDAQVLHSGPADNTPIVTLSGASWDWVQGDTGKGTCHFCQQTTGPQTWVLEKVD